MPGSAGEHQNGLVAELRAQDPCFRRAADHHRLIAGQRQFLTRDRQHRGCYYTYTYVIFSDINTKPLQAGELVAPAPLAVVRQKKERDFRLAQSIHEPIRPGD